MTVTLQLVGVFTKRVKHPLCMMMHVTVMSEDQAGGRRLDENVCVWFDSRCLSVRSVWRGFSCVRISRP